MLFSDHKIYIYLKSQVYLYINNIRKCYSPKLLRVGNVLINEIIINHFEGTKANDLLETLF